ncbi:hypothetical protein DFH06DRAFT_1475445 [Mycena polygramma]|nr:hypothetical protein DFH06DRAFT_1475445 [Mycena polygramma]
MHLAFALSSSRHAIRRNPVSYLSRSIAQSAVPTKSPNGPSLKRRPWRFWDMHTPEMKQSEVHGFVRTTFVRENCDWGRWTWNSNEITAEMSRKWCAIPETHLPASWSCDWSRWGDLRGPMKQDKKNGWWGGPELLLDILRRWYGIPAPLNPIMFRHNTTLFESRGTFYLFEQLDDLEDSEPDHVMFRFPGTYKSIEDFLENADWNEMKKIQKGEFLVASNPSAEILPLTHSEQGLRRASLVPYPKLNIFAVARPEGTWAFQARQTWVKKRGSQPLEHTSTWPSIPDELLPSPFSCNWHTFDPTYWQTWEYRGEMLDRWDVPDLTPVMFMAHRRHDCAFEVPTVLRAGHTYYLWKCQMDEYNPWLRKFEGTYASMEDFMENADWNRLSDDMEEKEFLESEDEEITTEDREKC